MALVRLDHVNVRTANLEEMSRFYEETLGLEPGPRPQFRFDGRWLYCADRAVVHFVSTEAQPAGHEPRIEHFAFRARDYAAFVANLERLQVPYDVVDVPPGTGQELRQIFVRDPDGNRVEIGFDKRLDAID